MWSDWNRAHITGHGGTLAMVESIIRDLSTQWQAVDTFTAKGLAVVIARDWTLVVHHDGSSI